MVRIVHLRHFFRRTFVAVVAPLFFFGMGALVASAQQVHAAQDELSDANITVRVFGPDNHPLGEQAFVVLYQQGSNLQLGTVTTNVGSTAVLTGMPGYGPYTIVVRANGYKNSRKDFEYNAASGRVEVDVVMEPASVGAAPVGPPPLDPKAQEHVDKGLQAMQAGKFQDAQKEFTAAQKAAPDNAHVYYLLGASYQKSNDLSKAQKYLAKAISIDADDVEALIALGQIQDQQKNYRAAISSLEKGVTIDAKNWLGHWVLADAYVHVGEYEKARKNAEAAVELGNGSANKALLIEGEALTNLGRRDDAIRVLDTFIRDVPADPAVPAVRSFIARLQSAQAQSSGKSN
ncbi:MAG: tetratricopeptide repeat protein [Candidatus Acidiferrales bacterium]